MSDGAESTCDKSTMKGTRRPGEELRDRRGVQGGAEGGAVGRQSSHTRQASEVEHGTVGEAGSSEGEREGGRVLQRREKEREQASVHQLEVNCDSSSQRRGSSSSALPHEYCPALMPRWLCTEESSFVLAHPRVMSVYEYLTLMDISSSLSNSPLSAAGHRDWTRRGGDARPPSPWLEGQEGEEGLVPRESTAQERREEGC
ncbi:hypothetical protein E2C01_022500 [Portunus trituberculatus]|uniref:Uncharacterized protein n=1 Tax=Portunus trituberculatus TaxID=210409 RepID=A0A5B7E7F6_PORTR|nr:hypothetical protein [Portunus trituberculatus]